MKRKVLASSIVSILLCISLIAGSTFALFTSQSKVNIAITSGKVDVVASIDGLELYSMDRLCNNNTFENGGTADIVGNILTLTNVSAGDKAVVTIGFTNYSTITIQYRIVTKIEGELSDDLIVSTVDSSNNYTTLFERTDWKKINVGTTVDSLKVAVELPISAGEEAEGITNPTIISISVEAIQGNADMTSGSNHQPPEDAPKTTTEKLFYSESENPVLNMDLWGGVNPDENINAPHTKRVLVYGLNPDTSLYNADQLSNLARVQQEYNNFNFTGDYHVAFNNMINDSNGQLKTINLGGAAGSGAKDVLKIGDAYKYTVQMDNQNNAVDVGDYGGWLVDYAVYLDRPVKAGTIGVAGHFDLYSNWQGFIMDMDLEANQEISVMRKLFSMYLKSDVGFDIGVPYDSLAVDGIQSFDCAPLIVDYQNAGLTMTVELRVYKPLKNFKTETSNNIDAVDFWSLLFSPNFEQEKIDEMIECLNIKDMGEYYVLNKVEYTVPSRPIA